MLSLREKILQRLRGRADMNLHSAGDHGPNQYHVMMARRNAYFNAIADVEEFMKEQPILTISENIHLPAKSGDVGYNLTSNHDAVVRTDEVSFIRTGVKIKLPDGYWAMLTSRSSAVFKHQIHVFNGIIDNGYVGELIVSCVAIAKQRVIPAGSSIAQLILFPICTPPLQLVESLPETDRGENGFGSTGKTGL